MYNEAMIEVLKTEGIVPAKVQYLDMIEFIIQTFGVDYTNKLLTEGLDKVVAKYVQLKEIERTSKIWDIRRKNALYTTEEELRKITKEADARRDKARYYLTEWANANEPSEELDELIYEESYEITKLDQRLKKLKLKREQLLEGADQLYDIEESD